MLTSAKASSLRTFNFCTCVGGGGSAMSNYHESFPIFHV